MASEKQKAGSRANGAKSRGPIAPEGRRRSARGNLEHGMPETAIENLLIHKMAVAHWRLMRAWRIHLNEYEMRFDRQFHPSAAAGCRRNFETPEPGNRNKPKPRGNSMNPAINPAEPEYLDILTRRPEILTRLAATKTRRAACRNPANTVYSPGTNPLTPTSAMGL